MKIDSHVSEKKFLYLKIFDLRMKFLVETTKFIQQYSKAKNLIITQMNI
nr:MAG TPA: hypothetical protein [Bacteriophage sp.]